VQAFLLARETGVRWSEALGIKRGWKGSVIKMVKYRNLNLSAEICVCYLHICAYSPSTGFIAIPFDVYMIFYNWPVGVWTVFTYCYHVSHPLHTPQSSYPRNVELLSIDHTYICVCIWCILSVQPSSSLVPKDSHFLKRDEVLWRSRLWQAELPCRGVLPGDDCPD